LFDLTSSHVVVLPENSSESNFNMLALVLSFANVGPGLDYILKDTTISAPFDAFDPGFPWLVVVSNIAF
jgi:hypothetical protein